jgi:hypothetical protein
MQDLTPVSENLPNVKFDPKQQVEVYTQAVRGLRHPEAGPEKQLKYPDFIDIYAGLGKHRSIRISVGDSAVML